ncbi:GYF domain-containing protein [Rubritalea marina]|uniref:GYF domain-containing protein n=1 Tax=Rubritalea marina TaxID=361055 RepID=UPI00037457EC|nr:GYF domain-containing protein [Rubritalea marina]
MWYYTLNGEQAGPVSEAELKEMLQSQLPSNTLVWQKGMSEWCPFLEVEAFRDLGTLAATTPSPAAPTTQASHQTHTQDMAIGTQPFSAVDCFSRSWKILSKRFGDIFLALIIYCIATLIGSSIITAAQFSIDASFKNSVTISENREPLTIAKPSTSESILEATEDLSIEEALDYQAPQPAQESNPTPKLSDPESLRKMLEEGWIESEQIHSPFASILGWILNQMLSSYLLIGFTVAVLAVLRGGKLDITTMFKQPLGRAARLFITSIVYGILIFIGILCFIIPGIYLSLRLMFYSTAIADKNLGIIESLQYSMDITKGKTLSLFGLGMLNLLAIIAGCILLFLGLIWALPLSMVSWFLAYENLRLRMIESQAHAD